MTYRHTIFQALADDTELNHYGLTEDTMFHNWQLPSKPVETGPFAILRWGPTVFKWGEAAMPTPLRLWVHIPYTQSNDHNLILPILAQADLVLRGLECVGGVGFVTPEEWSDDGNDEDFQTIFKSSLYSVATQREAA